MTVSLVLYALVARVPLRVQVRSALPYLVLIAFFEAGAYAAVSWGYSATPFVSVIAVLSGAFALPTVIGARLWLGERATGFQYIGTCVIILGAALVSAS
jgi:drug/metabolite transporter (DMT)-like permease